MVFVEIAGDFLPGTFLGRYDSDEDNFEGKTYFTRSLSEGDNPVGFYKKDKQVCGFLYPRSLRTGYCGGSHMRSVVECRQPIPVIRVTRSGSHDVATPDCARRYLHTILYIKFESVIPSATQSTRQKNDFFIESELEAFCVVT